ncbi:MAG: ParB N-terminal domain-containing protein [Planctomycetota bacterium]
MVARTELGRVRVETRRIADLVPAPYNPRRISDDALAGLGESIGRFGLVQPVIVNSRTGRIVGGHQRLKALAARGVEETDVVVVDLPEAEDKALNLALNSQAISGEWTADALALVEEATWRDAAGTGPRARPRRAPSFGRGPSTGPTMAA